MLNLLTPYAQYLESSIVEGIKNHIGNKLKRSTISFIALAIPYKTYTRAIEIFDKLSNGVNISARWKDNNPETGILEIYDYDRKGQSKNS